MQYFPDPVCYWPLILDFRQKVLVNSSIYKNVSVEPEIEEFQGRFHQLTFLNASIYHISSFYSHIYMLDKMYDDVDVKVSENSFYW